PIWIKPAANISIDIVDTDGFVLNLNFVFRRIDGRKFHRFQYLRATMLVKFNSCCHASSCLNCWDPLILTASRRMCRKDRQTACYFALLTRLVNEYSALFLRLLLATSIYLPAGQIAIVK